MEVRDKETCDANLKGCKLSHHIIRNSLILRVIRGEGEREGEPSDRWVHSSSLECNKTIVASAASFEAKALCAFVLLFDITEGVHVEGPIGQNLGDTPPQGT
jgi:hypothetical protein